MTIELTEDEQYLQPAIQYLRIKPLAYNALLFTFLSLAIVAACSRTGFRIWRFRRVEPDDILLMISLVQLTASTVVAFQSRDLGYLQMSVSLGFVQPPPDFAFRMATFQLLSNIGGVLIWASIFTVKLSFLVFFKKLVTRVRYLATWWWIALAIVVAGLATNVGLNFLICPHFGPSALGACTVAGNTHREGIYLDVTVAIDILTDLLVISIPIALLSRAKIDLRRKLALGTVCSLSIAMIILAIVRVVQAPVPSPISPDIPLATDSLWLFVLQTIEGAVAIIMVSITAFRSMLGQKGQSRHTSNKSTVADPEASNRLEELEKRQSVLDPTKQRERNENVWQSPGNTAMKHVNISAPAPIPPPKDPEGPLPARREFGSDDTSASSGWGPSHEELRQAPPPRTFV